MTDDAKAKITPAPDGPLLVAGLGNLSGAKGPIESKPSMALCRCGRSANKPFCDGSHKRVGFSSAKDDDRVRDRVKDYAGEEVTIHDNRGVCAHAAVCTDRLPSVFRYGERPWIDPNGASGAEIRAVVSECPSGALRVTPQPAPEAAGEPSIRVMPGGPYVVRGGPELVDTEFGEGAPRDHYMLCRCGASKNKPFCDGSHATVEFDEEAGE